MGGLLDLLPLLEGWDYHDYIVPNHIIQKGQPVLKLQIDLPGWLLQMGVATTDAYGTINLKLKSPGGYINTTTINPQVAWDTGFVQTDPTGYVSMYNRPIPLSTAGFYIIAGPAPGFSGFPLPYIGTVDIETFLDAPSTQAAAVLNAAALVIEIKDKRRFYASLKKLKAEGIL